LTGNFVVFDFKGKKKDIGLQLKHNAQNKRVLGFAKRKFNTSASESSYFLNDSNERNFSKFKETNTSSPWLFSNKASKLIESYLNKFPAFVKNLNEILANSNQSKLEITDLFDEEEKDPQTKFDEIVQWLKTLPHFTEPLISTDIDLLPNSIIADLEKHVLTFEKKEVEKPVKDVLDTVLFYKPPDPFPFSYNMNSDFTLGDVVINISGTGAVPFGKWGIVVSVIGENVEVIFDSPFIGGTK
jgi:5'-3' exoribonuclease 1